MEHNKQDYPSGKKVKALKRKTSNLQRVLKIFSFYSENPEELFNQIEWVDGDMLDYSDNSAFWAFNRVSNMCYLRYNYMVEDVKKVQSELTNKFATYTQAIDKAAMVLYSDDPTAAREFLTDYSCQQGDLTTKKWIELSNYLLVKYIDGNIKKEKDGKFLYNGTGVSVSPDQPGYSEAWKKAVSHDAGEKLRVIETKK